MRDFEKKINEEKKGRCQGIARKSFTIESEENTGQMF
jgi:hypothetical protein